MFKIIIKHCKDNIKKYKNLPLQILDLKKIWDDSDMIPFQVYGQACDEPIYYCNTCNCVIGDQIKSDLICKCKKN
jgi:hypothetical protein